MATRKSATRGRTPPPEERREDEAMASTYDRIYAVVKRIPKGRVATYGQVAEVAGLPKHARMVGYAMAALRASSVVPWQRVVNAAGEVSCRRNEAGGRLLQRMRLEQEGVRFDAHGRIDLDRYRWKPETGQSERTPLALKPARRGTTARDR